MDFIFLNSSFGAAVGASSLMITLLLIVFIWIFIRRFKRCPSDKLMVIYGKVGSDQGERRTAKVIHGGAAFVWPVIQDYQFLDLTPIPIEVDLRGALSNQNIRVNVPARFMVGISTEPGVMQNAAERLLGLSLDAIHDLAADIIFGQLRVVIATMTIEEINSDREKFLNNVSEAVEHELKKIGLQLINVNITDITDDTGYIEALGKEATAHAINEAKKLVAEKERDGAIGEAIARKEQRIQVANANSEAEIGEAEADQRRRIMVAEANARAVEGENLSQVKIAESEAKKRIEISRANKEAEIAEKTNEAEARKAAYVAQKEAEEIRAQRDKATRYADIIVPAEIEKQRIEIEAEAEAEKIRRIAKGEADSTYMSLEAYGKGTFEVLTKQAEGFKRIVEATNGDPAHAMRMMIADKLEDIVALQVDAIKNIRIDKITVWDSGNGNDSSTAGFLRNLYKSVPPLEDIFNMAGMDLPDYMIKKKEEDDASDVSDDTDAEG